MKNFPKIKIFIITVLLTLFSTFALAKACPLETIGLSKNNQKNKFNEVFALQMIISQYSNIYPDALVTGYFGPKTEAAIKRIQSDNGLNDNGVITQDTLELICSQYYQCPFQSMIGRGDELNPEQKIEAKMLQYLLRYLPKVNYRGSTNGVIGPLTEKSITTFQKEYDLYPTQILDFDTNNELCKIFENINNQKLSAPVSQTKTTTTYSISPLKAICVAEPSNGQVNQTISFLSQVFGGKPPYTYY
jgi:peptidoglycan hydrolase-like protein with peptidoglycan-binding domain